MQSESAMLVCRAIEPKAGMRILDACCAPGGKTAYMASLAKNGCSITGFELHEHRRELTLNTLKRLHAENAEIVQRMHRYTMMRTAARLTRYLSMRRAPVSVCVVSPMFATPKRAE